MNNLLEKAKTDLYSLLLNKKVDELSEIEIELMFQLSRDPCINKILVNKVKEIISETISENEMVNNIKVYCSDCKLNFGARLWHSGSCPKCKHKYCWDEQVVIDEEGIEDEIPVIVWEDKS